MSTSIKVSDGACVEFWTKVPDRGQVTRLLRERECRVLIGHPTFENHDNIGRQVRGTIEGAARSMSERSVAVAIVDGSLTAKSGDDRTLIAAREGVLQAMNDLEPAERARLTVLLTPYEGYDGDSTPGKGSALKLLFEESLKSPIETVILLDGDLRNDMPSWLSVYGRVEEFHRRNLPECDFFVTARYARHFVDASLSRFIVGPLTTLLGTWVPGGISGDIALSSGAIRHEQGPWSEERRRYGTDISTTFDNIADGNTAIYEIWLGAKLHDITDEGKLSVMPGEVIGAALESLLRHRPRLMDVLRGDAPLEEPVRLGPSWTDIGFIDPGRTDVFDVDLKLRTLDDRWDEFAADIRRIVTADDWSFLSSAIDTLRSLRQAGEGELRFLGFDAPRWRRCLGSAVAYCLATNDLETPKRALNYLYTAAFLEFCRERLFDLGLSSLAEIRRAQSSLGVSSDDAQVFYEERVDGLTEDLARSFYEQRSWILEDMGRFG